MQIDLRRTEYCALRMTDGHSTSFFILLNGSLLLRESCWRQKSRITIRCPKEPSWFCSNAPPGVQRNALLVSRRIRSQVVVRRNTDPSDAQSGAQCPYLLGLAGVPGSGKTSVAQAAVALLNDEPPHVLTKVLSMDGFHYTRRELDRFPNPAEAHARRGAPWTFDAERFVRALSHLRTQGRLVAPAFDHAKMDPEEGVLLIGEDVEAVVVEGNYLLMEAEPWCKVRELLDEIWFLEVDLDVADRRVIDRHISQLKLTEEQARLRVVTNDRLNAELISPTRRRADSIISGGS